MRTRVLVHALLADRARLSGDGIDEEHARVVARRCDERRAHHRGRHPAVPPDEAAANQRRTQTCSAGAIHATLRGLLGTLTAERMLGDSRVAVSAI